MQNNKTSTSDTGKMAKEIENRLRDIPETSRAASNIASSLGFIDTVKNISVKDNTHEVYDGFIQLMQEFHLQRIDLAGVAEKVAELFKGYPGLHKQFDEEFLQPSKEPEKVIHTNLVEE